MTIPAADWLGAIGREYLAEFVAEGGGAVRFVVADAPVLEATAAGLRARASGLQVIALDVAVVRLHMLQNVVFAVAAALPWPELLQARLASLLGSAGYRWPEQGAADLASVAEWNGVAPHLLRRDLTQALSREVWRDPGMTQDMRHAMIALLEARLGLQGPEVGEAVMAWLDGTLRSLAAVKPAQIGRRIGRQNARATLMSLCRWVRACGRPGILLLIDIRQLHRERRDVAEGWAYSPAAVMDCYEVLRQLIDDIEHFPGLFVACLADEAFLSDDPRRSLGQYTALQMRIWDDVRPAGGDNVLAPLARLIA